MRSFELRKVNVITCVQEGFTTGCVWLYTQAVLKPEQARKEWIVEWGGENKQHGLPRAPFFPEDPSLFLESRHLSTIGDQTLGKTLLYCPPLFTAKPDATPWLVTTLRTDTGGKNGSELG